ncbi:serine hydrolase domain-containing protein [Thalassotalea atypica]|uniref:serine hydrolase domain-containing protein n=1 Tax=Thalassotalea atypica TaxID=2054316 RepID=UPI0025736A24|nr:serine hydrolase [Thalassotalea atypica]
MKIKLKFKGLLAVTLLSCLSNTVAAKPAPEVSEADAKISFWDMPYLERAYIQSTPEERKDNIPVGHLGVDGGNKKMIIQLAKDIAEKKYGLVDSLLIAHQGKLLFESYYLRGRVDLPHMQASSTKSYVSLAVGRAIQLGYLTMDDLNKPLVSFLSDLDRSKLIDGADTITLHKALTMSSGMQISRDQIKEFKKTPGQLKGQGQVQTFLEHSPAINAETQRFNYSNTDPILVMQVLEAVVPGTAKAFIKKELLDKMEIVQYAWKDDVSGLPMAPYSSSMTSRNMLKWGTLIKNNGKWNGEQLVPKAFIAKATNRIVHPNADETFFVGDNVVNPGYGYYFWQADMKVGDKNYYTRSAQGGGGQYIILIDELDLIVVTTAHERDDRTMKMTAERVLPAFVQ